MKILLVEDDLSIGEFLSTTLTAYRYTVDLATDGELGLELAIQGEYAVIVLDIVLPKLDGLSICRKLREQGCQTPILMLTAKDSDEDVVVGLDMGADDYVTKPCESSQLIARIRALLRRQATAISSSVLTWGKLCLDPNLIQVTYQQQLITLSPKEYSLLELFLRYPQRIFSRSAIIDHLWSIDESPTDAAVTNLIKDLRRKLKAVGMMEELIETVYRLGYRLKVAPNGDIQDKQAKVEPEQEEQTDLEPEGLELIEEVAQDFQASLAERIEVLEKAVRSLQIDNFDSAQREYVIDEAHRLAGGLGTFGYAKGSELARAIEHLLREKSEFGKQELNQFLQLLAQLQQEIDQPPVSMISQPQTGIMPLILVIDDDHLFCESLRQAAPMRGLQIEIADKSTPLHQITNNPPSVVLVSFDRNSMAARLTLLEKLKVHFPAIPVLILAEEDSLDTRITVARLGMGRYLLKPTTTDEVFEAIAKILPSPTIPNAKVMIVDDDPVQLKALTALLQPWGVQVTCVCNPQQFWQVLISTEPDLLLLDLEMPKFNGFELCRVVRQDSKYADLPVLVVTAHTSTSSIQQVFAAGADEFIAKPIVGPELVTRVLSRIERTRMQQQLLRCQQQQLQVYPKETKIDLLTQVASRHYLAEFLEQQWQRLIHKRSWLCLIICDIDHFQAYNDHYSYQSENTCLLQVAQAICQCIDPSRDLVARSGADEFMIGLPDKSLDGALQVVERIQQAIANLQIPHPSLTRNSHITLSFGITGAIPTPEKSYRNLIATANQALSTAKARGCNTYCLYSL
ncbi:response regulator [Fischerella sp. NIES-3754]|uniref:response regulator n=1 Tax=Fischerella sp. NIES-3754 TaxID=1752063 RepID=UPI0007214EA1|nr:response regulator [Fischerella sp. NIES-3754]BAU05545.1 multi-component transcriptional regulator, winged helix family [Fischerella sp. NIES-3754]BCX07809.1 MAG: transcriptional regulator [Fischerella sp.]